MIYIVDQPADRRELDSFVRSLYDDVSEAGDRLTRHGYEMLIRGGSNALHKFGSIIVPQVRSSHVGQAHVIELA